MLQSEERRECHFSSALIDIIKAMEYTTKKIYSAREFACLLRNNGYSYDRTKGDHVIYKKNGQLITFTARPKKRMIVKRLIKEYSLMT